MPTIDPSLVPVINPGDLFDEFTTDASLNIRWLTAGDPCHFEILNRPLADIALRQLILAKALDALDVSLGYQAIFPFIINPQITSGSAIINLPVRVFWDIHVSVPTKWVNLRLARVDRLDGVNGTGGTGTSSDYTGHLRFIFTAQQSIGGVGGAEIAIFYADYDIDSALTYQRVRITPANSTDILVGNGITNILDPGDTITIDGSVVFRTLDAAETQNQDLFDFLAPGSVAMYEVVDSQPLTPDFETSVVSHGTGMLTSSAYNYITEVASAPSAWLEAFNYPFDLNATLAANDSSGITIPSGLFGEFDIVAPAGDQPTGDSSGAFHPVWVNKIERVDGSVPTLILYFSTFGLDPINALNTIEFATLTLTKDMLDGQVVAITPYNHLFPSMSGANWHQEFGRGHVVLSAKWSATGGEVDDFFDAFPVIVGGTTSATFSQGSTRVGSWGISRVPKYTPTAGQAGALAGSSSDRATPIYPSTSNKYITESDEGLGDLVDLDSQTGITANAAINRYGNTSTSVHKLVKLIVDPDSASAGGANFYTDQVLPRLRILLGRDPVFGDTWYSGVRFMVFNGDSWIC